MSRDPPDAPGCVQTDDGPSTDVPTRRTACLSYLIERALTDGEVDALAADYLAEAAELCDCPMRTSRVARALEVIR
ncbi:MAG TPA: hypothetical protein VHR88_06250 [Solirubrobacteraceae bacterium]|jgi:hypothetical protein|nr:hypothetical protein [Solirubrobacteraceae bacterium]